MNLKKLVLLALLAVLLVGSIVLAAFAGELGSASTSDTYAALFGGGNGRLTKAVIGLVAFVVLGLLGLVYKGPRR